MSGRLTSLTSKLTYANVLATVALFLALGGTSYAVTALPRNSVGTKQLKARAVTKGKVAKNAIDGSHVRDGSLSSVDFAAGTLLRGERGEPGAAGPQGIPGAAGSTGDTGPQGVQGPAGTLDAPGFATSTILSATNPRDTAVAIGSDGYAVIAAVSAPTVYVSHCENLACSAATTTQIATGGSTAGGTSIAINSQGVPVVAFHGEAAGASGGQIKVATCANVVCTSATTEVVDPGAGSVYGDQTSITIGTDGLPVVAYFTTATRDLLLVHCTSATCSTASAPITVASAGWVGEYVDIAVGTDGRPVMAYYDRTNGDVEFARCADAVCTSASASTFATANSDGLGTSIAIGGDGLPVITYGDTTGKSANLIHCTAMDCSTTDATVVLATDPNAIAFTSVAIGSDGLPAVSFYRYQQYDLGYAHCATVTCASNSTATLLTDGIVGGYSTLAFGVDGRAVIASTRAGVSPTIPFVHCGSITCTPNQRS
ncbi:MAG: collagen-like triple helix repeat-containing protein [Gaiellales bacterium]